MTARSPVSLSTLYDRDLALWYADTLTKLKTGDLESLDIDHLVEEIEGLAARDRRELTTRLKVLLAHLLKRLYVPMPENYRGWENSINEQREQLQDLLSQSPSLQAYFNDVFDTAWHRALRQVQQDYPPIKFPAQWPHSREPDRLLTDRVDGFWPQ